MARLSRTAKYAELRNQISQDRETAVYTEELGKFENKLKGIQNSANGTNEDILRRETENVVSNFESVNKEENYQAPNATYIEPQTKPTPVQEPTPVVVTTPVVEPTPVVTQTPVVETKPVQEPTPVVVATPVVEPTPVVQATPVVEIKPVQEVAPVVEPTPVVEVKPVVEEVKQEINKEFKPEEANSDFFEFLNSLDTTNLEKDIQESIESVPEEVIIEAPIKEEEIVNEYKDSIEDIAKLIQQDNIEINGDIEPVVEEEKPIINNDFINNAINEVNDYNKNDGRKTIDELSSQLVEAVRHPENSGLFKSDDEFSNTVSLEIDKVLNEIKAEAANVVKQAVEEAVKEETKVVADIKPNTAEVVDDGLEIKPMEETLRQDVLDDTIPFVMNAEEQNAVEELEDEGPNKILNIILIVLIVILLAILAVIVYYILYAKGIIGWK